MAKKWTKREIGLLKASYQVAEKLGMRVVLFTEGLSRRSRAQCLDQARRLGIQRKKSGGFGLQWRCRITEFEKYYIAGILDGEGYISTNYGNYLVGVAMTDKKLIRWLQQKLGGTFQLRKRRMGKNGWNRQEYAWKINGMKQVRSFLSVMLPYLRIKNVKAKQVIKEIDKKSL